MKQKETPMKFALMSGEEEVTRTSTIMGIVRHLGCTQVYLYNCKLRDVNKDGSWAFNYKNINYTIKSL